MGSAAQADIGPAIPAPAAIYGRARSIESLARIARECTTRGHPAYNPARAAELLRQIARLSQWDGA